MGLLWVRLDCAMPSNPKILALIEAKRFKAAFGYLCALTYAGQHGTDGFIPASALPFIHMTRADANHCADAGLFEVVPGGWDINDWHEFQMSNSETQARKQRARDAALARWHPK